MRENTIKLPRGSYYYVSLGDQFFAGLQPVTVEVKPTQASTYAAGLGRPIPGPKGGIRWNRRVVETGYPRRDWVRANSSRAPRSLEVRVKQEPMPHQQHTGQHSAMFVNDPLSAKQFRRKQSAQACVDRLTVQYGSLGVNPKIHLYQPENHNDR